MYPRDELLPVSCPKPEPVKVPAVACVRKPSCGQGPAPWAEFAACHCCSQYNFTNVVAEQLSRWRLLGISPELMRETIRQSRRLKTTAHFSIHKGVLTYTNYTVYGGYTWYANRAHSLLKLLLQRLALPDLEFLLYLWDKGQVPFGKGMPLFAFCKHTGTDDILFPDPDWMETVLKHKLRPVTDPIPFSKRTKRIVWRGTNTGPDYIDVFWRWYPRPLFLDACAREPGMCDAGFTSVRTYKLANKSLAEELRRVTAGPIPSNEQSQFRYTAVVTGNTAAFRLGRVLASGSTVFLQAGPYELFYQTLLRPWVHFVPVSSGFADLAPRWRWANEHEAEAEAIAANGAQFARDYLTLDATLCYIGELLSAYAALLRREPLPRFGASPAA